MSQKLILPSLHMPKVLSRREHKKQLIRLLKQHSLNAFAGMEGDSKSRKIRKNFFNAQLKAKESFSFCMTLVGCYLLLGSIVYVVSSAYYFTLFLGFASLIFGVLWTQSFVEFSRQERSQRDDLIRVLRRKKVVEINHIDYQSYKKTAYSLYFQDLTSMALAAFIEKYSHKSANNVMLAFYLSQAMKEKGVIPEDNEDFDLYLGNFHDFKATYGLNKGAFWEISRSYLLKFIRFEAGAKDYVPKLKYAEEERVLERILTADQKEGMQPFTLEQLTSMLNRSKSNILLAADSKGLFSDLASVVELNQGLEALTRIVAEFVEHRQKMLTVQESETLKTQQQQEEDTKQALHEFNRRLEKNIEATLEIVHRAENVVKAPAKILSETLSEVTKQSKRKAKNKALKAANLALSFLEDKKEELIEEINLVKKEEENTAVIETLELSSDTISVEPVALESAPILIEEVKMEVIEIESPVLPEDVAAETEEDSFIFSMKKQPIEMLSDAPILGLTAKKPEEVTDKVNLVVEKDQHEVHIKMPSSEAVQVTLNGHSINEKIISVAKIKNSNDDKLPSILNAAAQPNATLQGFYNGDRLNGRRSLNGKHGINLNMLRNAINAKKAPVAITQETSQTEGEEQLIAEPVLPFSLQS